MTWIQTLDGGKFDLDTPDPNAIKISTLAVGLSQICRFGGHCEPFYSVGQHSIWVHLQIFEKELRLPALLHDAHELYWGFGDVTRPAKNLTPHLKEILQAHAYNINKCIADRFKFDWKLFYHPKIKHIDNVALSTEARDLMKKPPEPWIELPEPHPKKIIPNSMSVVASSFEMILNTLTS